MKKIVCMLLALLLGAMGSMEVYAMQGTGAGGTMEATVEKTLGEGQGPRQKKAREPAWRQKIQCVSLLLGIVFPNGPPKILRIR